MSSMLKLCVLVIFAVVVLANPVMEQNNDGMLPYQKLSVHQLPSGFLSDGEGDTATPKPTEATTTATATTTTVANSSSVTTPGVVLIVATLLPMVLRKFAGTY